MDYRTVAKNIAQNNMNPLYVCYGEEAYLMEEFITYLKKKWLVPLDDMAVSTYDLTEISLAEIIEDAMTPGFLTPKKLIIAQRAEFLTASRLATKLEHPVEALLNYIESPNEDCIIVLCVQAEKLDERKKIVKHLKANHFLVTFQQLSARELIQWVQKKFQQEKAQIDDDAVNQLIMQVGTELRSLAGEISKHVLHAGQGQTITVEQIRNLSATTLEQDVFLLIDAIVHRRENQALSILYDLFMQKEPPLKLAALLLNQFRLITQVKYLNSIGTSQRQIASHLSIHPYRVKLAIDQARSYELAQLYPILRTIVDYDYELKSGKVEPESGLQMLLLKIIAAA